MSIPVNTASKKAVIKSCRSTIWKAGKPAAMHQTTWFDTQKLKNPDIQGVEYQNGGQKGFSNVREYVLFRDEHTCKHCK